MREGRARGSGRRSRWRSRAPRMVFEMSSWPSPPVCETGQAIGRFLGRRPNPPAGARAPQRRRRKNHAAPEGSRPGVTRSISKACPKRRRISGSRVRVEPGHRHLAPKATGIGRPPTPLPVDPLGNDRPRRSTTPPLLRRSLRHFIGSPHRGSVRVRRQGMQPDPSIIHRSASKLSTGTHGCRSRLGARAPHDRRPPSMGTSRWTREVDHEIREHGCGTCRRGTGRREG